MATRTVGTALALTVGALAVGGVVAWRRVPAQAATVMPAAPSEPETKADWCTGAMEPMRGNACFAAPAAPRGAPLVVYIHGMYGAENANEEATRQERVVRMGVQKGFAVLVFRGEKGECKNAQIPDYVCWPSNPRNEADGPTFVARWQPALDDAAKRTGASPRYLLGFSNGAYFASLISTRALVKFDGIAIAHGGPVEPTRASGPTPPLLLISADDDPSDGEMGLLDQELVRERWPHVVVAREGGHALLDWDVEMALTFFQRIQKEAMPLSPALARGRIPTPPPPPGDDAESPTPTSPTEEPKAAPTGEAPKEAPPADETAP